MDKVILFNSKTPEYAWLSNFQPCTIPCKLGGNFYSVEHAYQAAKSIDIDEQLAIRNQRHPASAKALSKTLKHLRPHWDEVKERVMLKALRIKFTNPELKQKLLDTGDSHLFHLSPWDTYWGVDAKGGGQNRLGILLMQVRQELRMDTFDENPEYE